MSYMEMPLPQQKAMMDAESRNVEAITTAIQMWTNTQTQLDTSIASLGQRINALTGNWNDAAGDTFLLRAQAAQSELTLWHANAAKPIGPLGTLAEAIPPTAQIVTTNHQEFLRLQPMLANPLLGPLVQQMILELQHQSGQQMDQLATTYRTAEQAVIAAGSGGPWTGPLDSAGAPAGGAPGAPGALPAGGAGPGAAAAGGDPAAAGGAPAAGAGGGAPAAGGGAPTGGGAPGGGTPGGGPSLDGLAPGTAPILPPGLGQPPTSLPPLTPTLPPVGGGGLPIIPPISAIGAAGGGGRSGAGGFNPRTAGLRVPGVSLGGLGTPSIPQAAQPVAPVPTALTSGQPPALSQTAGTTQPTTGQTVGSGGGMPPVAPPMTGIAGSGGKPGPGRADRKPPTGRGRGPNPTPGLPTLLRGKAGKTDPLGFPPPFHPTRRERAADVPTIQLLDDELWQVEDAPVPAVVGEQPKAPARRLAR
ncbi:WXG100 family type VII secretion target [Actinokineospora sp.]|uniref:WXG100 family type VII secretion target n=1 Tax=Actinokineospora sp. TaxID=1872133 RepID=UPI004037E470